MPKVKTRNYHQFKIEFKETIYIVSGIPDISESKLNRFKLLYKTSNVLLTHKPGTIAN